MNRSIVAMIIKVVQLGEVWILISPELIIRKKAQYLIWEAEACG